VSEQSPEQIATEIVARWSDSLPLHESHSHSDGVRLRDMIRDALSAARSDLPGPLGEAGARQDDTKLEELMAMLEKGVRWPCQSHAHRTEKEAVACEKRAGEAGARLRALQRYELSDGEEVAVPSDTGAWVLWAALDALLSAIVVSGWQPIATAPKEGWMLLADQHGSIHCGCNDYGGTMVIVFDAEAWELVPIEPAEAGFEMTHWMPLPAAPVVTQEGE
jgi:hypothetical protein